MRFKTKTPSVKQCPKHDCEMQEDLSGSQLCPECEKLAMVTVIVTVAVAYAIIWALHQMFLMET